MTSFEVLLMAIVFAVLLTTVAHLALFYLWLRPYLLRSQEKLDRLLAVQETRDDARAAKYPLSNQKLLALAAKHKPPQSWYEQETKPF